MLLNRIAAAANTSSSAVPENQVKEKIKERLEKVVDEDLDKIKGEVDEKIRKRAYAYAGTITSIDGPSFLLASAFGDEKVRVASDTAIFQMINERDKKAIKLDDLTPGQYAIAMGYLNPPELEARRIIIMTKPLADARRVVNGKITELDDKKITFKYDSDSETITINEDTKLKIVGIEKPTLEKVQIGDQLVAILTKDKKEKELAKLVYIHPGLSNPTASLETNATSSASPKKP